MKKACIILLILIASVLEYRTVVLTHGHFWFNEVITGNQSILQGESECYVFQGRVLGPSLVQAATAMFEIPFNSALCGFFMMGMFITNLMVYFIVEYEKGSTMASLFTVTNAFAYALLQDQHSAFTFDVIDSLTMFLFAYGCFSRKGFWFMVSLFAVEIHNREFGLVIAGWIILDGLDRMRFWQAVAGAVMLWSGKIYINWLRKVLTVHEHHDTRLEIKWNQNWFWPYNWQQIKTLFADKFIPISYTYASRLDQLTAILVLVTSFTISVWYIFRNPSFHSFNILLVVCAFVISVLLFTCMSELRGLEQIAPFMIFALFWTKEIEPMAPPPSARGDKAV